MESLQIEEMSIPGYESVYLISDKQAGLKCIIAIHHSRGGHPTIGGARIYPYASFDDALNDALRLSKGMTEKSLLAGAQLGGAKAVIIADPKSNISDELLYSFAFAVDALKGRYYTAEDSGMTQDRLMKIREKTPYVVGVEVKGSSGNPCPSTAWGTLRGIQATAEELWGSTSLKGKVVAIQGLGFVGMILAELLFWEGADLVVSDLSAERVEAACQQFDATPVEPDAIYDVSCDIFSPCAMGGILNETTIPRLKCKAIAGCANNQLLDEKAGQILHQRGILYAPDIVVNAGGLINVEREIYREAYQPTVARDRINQIQNRVKKIFSLAKSENLPTSEVTKCLIEEQLKMETADDERRFAFAKDFSTP